jgi:hypothetical protein
MDLKNALILRFVLSKIIPFKKSFCFKNPKGGLISSGLVISISNLESFNKHKKSL